jgi:histidine phosphotransfer protein HptB
MLASAIIDPPTFAALKESMGDDFIVELVQTYFEETPRLISTLQDALDRRDNEAFRRAAHSIKSSSNSFGALQFGLLAKELEMLGKEASLDDAAGKVELLVKDYPLVKETLEVLCHE